MIFETRFHRRRLLLPLASLALALLLGCASQIPPSGGPPDTEPPVISRSEPMPGAVRVNTDRIVLEFDEYVDPQSVEQAVHFSPLQEKRPELSWSGKELTIVFSEPLLPNRTYVVTIGSAAKDQHAGNHLKAPYQLAFSTGDSVDTGTIRGFVQDEKPTEVSLFAYMLLDTRGDTLSPTRTKPDYTVTANEDGRFSLDHLTEGEYRVYAVRDRQKNFLYDVEADDIGTDIAGDVVVSSGTPLRELRFTVAREDTTAPGLSSVTEVSARILELRLTEDVLYPENLKTHLTLQDSASGRLHQIVDILAQEQRKNTYRIFVDPAFVPGLLLGHSDSLTDAKGNRGVIDFSLEVTAEPDTLKPRLLRSFPPDGAKGVPRDSLLRWQFTRPLSSLAQVTLRNSSGRPVSFIASRVKAHEISLRPDLLLPAATYTLCVDLRTCLDSLENRSAGDSVLCVNFTTDSEDQYGKLSGLVSSPADSVHEVLLHLKPFDNRLPEITTRAQPRRSFVKTGIPAGTYRMRGFIDRNGNGVLDSGTPHPYVTGERFFSSRDSVRIRVKWETRTGTIIIP